MKTSQMIKRLTKLLATFTGRLEGVTWYSKAGELVTELAERYQVTRECVAGVLAVTSPRLHWKRNVQVTHEILAGVTPSGIFRANLDKAWRIRNGEEPTKVLSGPKVSAFFLALLGDANAVVIDVWMLRALRFTRKLTQKAYDALADLIRTVAREVGMTPAQFQAAVWVAVRGRAT